MAISPLGMTDVTYELTVAIGRGLNPWPEMHYVLHTLVYSIIGPYYR